LTNKPITDVSVIVPNYNNGRYLDAFIGSVTNSTVEPAELIIVDDGSTDNSLEILARHKHLPYLKIIVFKKNKGLTAALNAALEASGGKYVMRADPDDRLAPNRIEKQFIFMEQNPEVDILGCNSTYFDDATDKEINKSNFPEGHKNIIKTYKKGEHGLLHSTAFAKGKLFRSYRYQKLFPGEDYELFSRMVRDGHKFANLNESLYFVRVHARSATSNLKREHIKNTFMFRDQIFGTKTSNCRIWFYYFYILNYRKFQGSYNPFRKLYFLSLAAVCYPAKVIKRIVKL